MKTYKEFSRLYQVLFRALIVLLIIGLCSVGFVVRQIQRHRHVTHASTTFIGGSVAYQPGRVPKVGAILTTLRGSGNGRTTQFKAPGNWIMYWNFSCENAAENGNFSAVIYDSKGTLSAQNKAIIEHRDESGYGATQYHSGGTFYVVLRADSTCTWGLTIKTAD